MKVAQFGTFDIYNYGDLLFPLLLQRRFQKADGLELVHVSPTSRRTCADCATCVSVLDVAADASTVDAALIGGGNIIHCSSSSLDYYRASGKSYTAYGDLWIRPFFILPEHCPIVWMSPGVPGPFPKEDHRLVEMALRRASYLSVRDEESKAYLLDVWPDAEVAVAPDPAWAIDDLWSEDELREAYHEALSARGASADSDRYVIMHLNRRYLGRLTVRETAAHLDDIAHHLQARPLLIAFGACHGDDVLLENLAAHMKTAPMLMCRGWTLKAITACIKHACAYVGSSMHGLIAASVFGVPGFSVANPGMPKFAGLSALIGLDHIFSADIARAAESLKGIDLTRRRQDLVAVSKTCRQILDDQWKVIQTTLSRPRSDGPFGEEAEAFGLKRFVEYEAHLMRILLEVSDGERRRIEDQYRQKIEIEDKAHQKQVQALQAEIKRIQKTNPPVSEIRTREKHIRVLQAEIKRMRNSLSWRITRPLRLLSRRYPILADACVRPFAIVRRIIAAKEAEVGEVPRDETVTASKWVLSQSTLEQIRRYQNVRSAAPRRIVIYTAIFGGYDNLFVPETISEDCDYVCFTDRERGNRGVWQLRSSPYYHPDPTRIARFVKLHPHELFAEYDVAIWIDGNIVLRAEPQKFIRLVEEERLGLGLVPHPHRGTFFEEAEACKLRRKDDADVIERQIQEYKAHGVGSKAGMFETGFMVTLLKDQLVRSMFRIWWQQIEKYSKRDQLSLVWALEETSAEVAHLLPAGVSVREDEDFVYYQHVDCRNLETPSEFAELEAVRRPDGRGAYSDVMAQRVASLQNEPIDIIICVYNALDDVRACLDSVRASLRKKHRVIIVNDASDEDTSSYLRYVADQDDRLHLIENEVNQGYTKSANIGLRYGEASFRILLNSDTIVSGDWALKMMDAVMQSDRIGIVGPLSNAAGAQSIPDIKGTKNNTAINALPAGVTVADMNAVCEGWSYADDLPFVSLVHGFCIGIKQNVIDTIGYFDEDNFVRYYGEENDYCLRARNAGFYQVIATHTFVYHKKSASIEEQDRIVHMDRAGKKLREIYGEGGIREACLQIEHHPMLARMREMAKAYFNAPVVGK